MNKLELIIPPVGWLILVAGAMWGTGEAAPGFFLPLSGSFWFTFSFVGVGVMIGLSGVIEFRRAKTTIDPRVPHEASTLVTTGIYRLSRNPMYLGLLLALTGWAFYLSNGLAFVFLPLFVLVMNRFQIVPEERNMREKFGSEFDEYSSVVRRWI